MWQPIANLLPQVGDVHGKFFGSRRSLTVPEGNAGRRAVGIFYQHASRFAFDSTNSPRAVAQKHDVARIALDGEIFVECAHDDSFGLGNHGEQRSFGNGSAASD